MSRPAHRRPAAGGAARAVGRPLGEAAANALRKAAAGSNGSGCIAHGAGDRMPGTARMTCGHRVAAVVEGSG